MATQLNTNSVSLGSNLIHDGDLQCIRYNTNQRVGLWAWGYNGYPVGLYGRDQTVRGGYYVSRMIYGTTTLVDAYNNQYTGTGLYYPSNTVTQSYDTNSFTNFSVGKSIQVALRMNIGRATDDATQSILFRGGTPTPVPGTGPASLGGHSGGTQIYISGGTTASLLTYIDTIPANTTYTYWHYCGITGGSGGDGCTAWLDIEFWRYL